MNREFKPKGDLAINPKSIGLTWPQAPCSFEMRDGVYVMYINGPLEHQMNPWFDSYQSILNRFEGAMHDEEVTGILLCIDSPGGEVSGLQETVRRMRAHKERHGKPVVAYANDEAYSAAYAIACAADEIYLPDAGGLGSVGVLATLCDRTEATKEAGLRVEVIRSGTRKAEGHPDIPLDDAVLGRVQKRVDQLAKQFFKLVSQARPTNVNALEALQGQCLYGKRAVDAGLADGILSFEDVLGAMIEKSEVAGDQKGGTLSEHVQKYAGVDAMKPFAALEKKVADAVKAVMASTTKEARKAAVAELTKAQMALTEAKVKTKYNKKTTTVEEESEEDDGDMEAEEEEDEESASTSADDDGDDDGDDDDDDGPPSSEAPMKKKSSLESFVKSLTGQSSSVAAQQVLASMHEQAQQNAANAAKIAKLEADAAKSKVESLVTEGVAAGKIKPAQLAWAKTLSLKDLKAYLAATPAIFSARQGQPGPEVVETETEELNADGLTKAEAQICHMTGVSAELYKKQKAAGLPKTVKGN